MGLMLHAGADAINRNDLANLAIPNPRGSRHVIRPFIDDVELITEYLDQNGLRITEEAFGVKTDKDNLPSQFFGVLELAPKAIEGTYIAAGESESFALNVGIRGSYDQSLPRGLAIGSRVFVCDNLAFSGEINVYSKQTTNIAARIPQLLQNAIAQVPVMAELQNKRFDAYRNHSLSSVKGDAILIECVRRGILNPSDLGKAIKEWDEPSHKEHKAEGKTVWTLFNAITEAIKPTNKDRAHVMGAWNRTVPLTQYLDHGVGLIH